LKSWLMHDDLKKYIPAFLIQKWLNPCNLLQ
jgi:hypothetical protein